MGRQRRPGQPADRGGHAYLLHPLGPPGTHPRNLPPYRNDPETLAGLLAETGVPADRVRTVLAGTEYAEAVQADVDQAYAFGANGVPFFVIDRTYGISGAQPAEAFLHALRTARG